MSKIYDLTHAKLFLAHNRKQSFTPDRIHEILRLKCSVSTLGRRLRECAESGGLKRTYYTNDKGTKIAQYKIKVGSPLGKMLIKRLNNDKIWELPYGTK